MYLVFILTNVRRATMPILMIPLLVVQQVTGGYLVQPAWIGLMTLFCTMFVASPENMSAGTIPRTTVDGRRKARRTQTAPSDVPRRLRSDALERALPDCPCKSFRPEDP